jgi:hypothetical protein
VIYLYFDRAAERWRNRRKPREQEATVAGGDANLENADGRR